MHYTDFFDVELAQQRFAEDDFELLIRETTGSTSDDIKTWIRHGQYERPVVKLVFSQTQGRGTQNRPWINPQPSLLFSIGVCEPRDNDGCPYSILVGVGLAKALRSLGINAKLKWPNDLWVNGGKAGGILLERIHHNHQSYLVIGIGLNLLPVALRTTRGWLGSGLFTDETVLDPKAMAALWVKCVKSVVASLTMESVLMVELWNEYDVFKGQMIDVCHEDLIWTGRSQGINAEGLLLLDCNGKTQSILSGSITKVMMEKA